MDSRQHRLLSCSCLGAWLGLFGGSGCFDDPSTSLTDNDDEDEESGDGDGDSGDGDGDTGDGDGDAGDGDGDGDAGDGDGDGECEPDEDLCDGSCVNIDVDASNCGECGNVCTDFSLCGEAQCKPEKYAFVTSTTLQGNFGELAADAICMGSASTAGLPNGIYRAWISTANQSPTDWNLNDAVWRLRGPGDIAVAYSSAQLFSGNLAAPINRNEFGEPLPATPACNSSIEFSVWTGTSATGMPDGPNCMGWFSPLQRETGRIGNSAASDMNWSSVDGCTATCSMQLPIYCFQQ